MTRALSGDTECSDHLRGYDHSACGRRLEVGRSALLTCDLGARVGRNRGGRREASQADLDYHDFLASYGMLARLIQGLESIDDRAECIAIDYRTGRPVDGDSLWDRRLSAPPGTAAKQNGMAVVVSRRDLPDWYWMADLHVYQR
jgi:hypothetical protein